MKIVSLVQLIVGALISSSGFASEGYPNFGNLTPDSKLPKLILTCEGSFVKGGYDGNEYFGAASLKIYRREKDSTIWYSALFNAKRPNDQGVNDKLYLALDRIFYPSARPNELATGFEFITETDVNKNYPSKLSFRITDKCLLNKYSLADCPSEFRSPTKVYLRAEVTEKFGPSIRLYQPALTCKWEDREGHLNFYGE